MIPRDKNLWKLDRFDDFIAARKGLIREKFAHADRARRHHRMSTPAPGHPQDHRSDPLAASADIVAENISSSGALPRAGDRGSRRRIDQCRRAQAARRRSTLTDAEEKFGLNWHGKRRARQLALTPSTGTLRPAQRRAWTGTPRRTFLLRETTWRCSNFCESRTTRRSRSSTSILRTTRMPM